MIERGRLEEGAGKRGEAEGDTLVALGDRFGMMES